eukprot:g7541.t1
MSSAVSGSASPATPASPQKPARQEPPDPPFDDENKVCCVPCGTQQVDVSGCCADDEYPLPSVFYQQRHNPRDEGSPVDTSELSRRNGFQRPLQCAQVLSWVFVGLNFVLCTVYLVPQSVAYASQKDAFGLYVVAALYYVAHGVLYVAAYLAQAVDPSDALALRDYLQNEELQRRETAAQNHPRTRFYRRYVTRVSDCFVYGSVVVFLRICGLFRKFWRCVSRGSRRKSSREGGGSAGPATGKLGSNYASATSAEPNVNPIEGPELLYCTLCRSKVDSTSKHCTDCNKCVVEFDHHCVWMNTCVGRKNYHLFLFSIGALALVCTCINFLAAWMLVDYNNDHKGDLLVRKLRSPTPAELLGECGVEGYLQPVPRCHCWIQPAVYGFLLFINVPFWLLNNQLIFLHIFLMRNKLTTYEYIMIKLEREKEKESTTITLKSGRTLSFKKTLKALPGVCDWFLFGKTCGRNSRRGGGGTRDITGSAHAGRSSSSAQSYTLAEDEDPAHLQDATAGGAGAPPAGPGGPHATRIHIQPTPTLAETPDEPLPINTRTTSLENNARPDEDGSSSASRVANTNYLSTTEPPDSADRSVAVPFNVSDTAVNFGAGTGTTTMNEQQHYSEYPPSSSPLSSCMSRGEAGCSSASAASGSRSDGMEPSMPSMQMERQQSVDASRSRSIQVGERTVAGDGVGGGKRIKSGHSRSSAQSRSSAGSLFDRLTPRMRNIDVAEVNFN